MGISVATVTERPATVDPGWSPEAVNCALFAWFSPAFPTGGFAYSHGLETSVSEGRVDGECGLGAWLQDILGHGAGWSDAILLNLAHRASASSDEPALLHAADLALALAPSRERLAETVGQGTAFALALRTGWPGAMPDALPAQVAYPVASGAAGGLIGAPAVTVTTAYLTGFAANLIAAGVRLGLCGQSGGVRILHCLAPLIVALATRAQDADERDLGSCALASDIAGMRHEHLQARMFLT